MSSKRPKKAYPAKASAPEVSWAWPSMIRRRRSGSPRASMRSAMGSPAILQYARVGVKTLAEACRPSSTPIGRGATWALTSRPSAWSARGQRHQVAPPFGRHDVLLHRVADRASAGAGEGRDQFELGTGELVVRGAVAVREELEHPACPARSAPWPAPTARAPGPAGSRGSRPCWCGAVRSARWTPRWLRPRAPGPAGGPWSPVRPRPDGHRGLLPAPPSRTPAGRRGGDGCRHRWSGAGAPGHRGTRGRTPSPTAGPRAAPSRGCPPPLPSSR